MSEREGTADEPAAPGTAVVVTVDGELDAAESEWSEAISDALTDGRPHVVVDLRNVTFVDSSVVRTLLLLHRRLPVDGWIRLVFTHHLIKRVVEIVGLAEMFPQFTTVDAALRHAPTRHGRSEASPVSSPPDFGHTVGNSQSSGDAEPSEGH